MKRSENESDAERQKKLPVDCVVFLLCIERVFRNKDEEKAATLSKTFFALPFFEFTYSVFLRHSLDFDGVMW